MQAARRQLETVFRQQLNAGIIGRGALADLLQCLGGRRWEIDLVMDHMPSHGEGVVSCKAFLDFLYSFDENCQRTRSKDTSCLASHVEVPACTMVQESSLGGTPEVLGSESGSRPPNADRGTSMDLGKGEVLRPTSARLALAASPLLDSEDLEAALRRRNDRRRAATLDTAAGFRKGRAAGSGLLEALHSKASELQTSKEAPVMKQAFRVVNSSAAVWHHHAGTIRKSAVQGAAVYGVFAGRWLRVQDFFLPCVVDGRLAMVEHPPPLDSQFAGLRVWRSSATSDQHAGCRIQACEDRGITYQQLEALQHYATARCELDAWYEADPASACYGQRLAPSAVSLYNVLNWVVMPATQSRKCSFVEAVSEQRRPPRWFVSHWNGEILMEFVASIRIHSMLRGPADQTAAYWIAAFAYNQWSLVSEDLSSFQLALARSQGTLLAVDSQACVFNRLWCMYESFLTFRRHEGALFDIAIATPDGEEPAVLIADGLTQQDEVVGSSGHWRDLGGAYGHKLIRERRFPEAVMVAAQASRLQAAAVSLASDRRRILESMADYAGLPPVPEGTLDSEEEHYENLNAVLRWRVSLAFAPAAAARGQPLWEEHAVASPAGWNFERAEHEVRKAMAAVTFVNHRSLLDADGPPVQNTTYHEQTPPGSGNEAATAAAIRRPSALHRPARVHQGQGQERDQPCHRLQEYVYASAANTSDSSDSGGSLRRKDELPPVQRGRRLTPTLGPGDLAGAGVATVDPKRENAQPARSAHLVSPIGVHHSPDGFAGQAGRILPAFGSDRADMDGATDVEEVGGIDVPPSAGIGVLSGSNAERGSGNETECRCAELPDGSGMCLLSLSCGRSSESSSASGVATTVSGAQGGRVTDAGAAGSRAVQLPAGPSDAAAVSVGSAVRLTCTGVQQVSQGELKAALASFNAAKALREQAGTLVTPEGMTLLINIAVATNQFGDLQGALEAYGSALIVGRRAAALESAEGALLLRSFGAAVRRQGDLQVALQAFEASRAVLTRTGHLASPAGALLLTDLAAVKSELGDVEASLSCFQAARQVREQTGTLQTREGARLLMDIATALERKGEHQAALDGYRLADDVWSSVARASSSEHPEAALLPGATAAAIQRLRSLLPPVSPPGKQPAAASPPSPPSPALDPTPAQRSQMAMRARKSAILRASLAVKASPSASSRKFSDMSESDDAD